MALIKTHAYGNDFLLAAEADLAGVTDRTAFARRVCDRHRGLGADGLMWFSEDRDAVRAHLLNADGSSSELSGNGVRCLAAWIASERNLDIGRQIHIATDAGRKSLTLLERGGTRLRFRAAMGEPTELREETIDVDGTPIACVVLRVGNPQCDVLGHATETRLATIAAKL